MKSQPQNLTIQNKLTLQLLKQMDKERSMRPTAQTIMQPSANVFSIIRQMYNSYKKDNQSRILQNKVYELKIYDPSQINTQNGKQFTPVALKSLCSNHSKQFDVQIIDNLITLKSYLPLRLQTQLIIHISQQISKIDDLPTILQSYKKLLKTKQCINDRSQNGLYKRVEKQMMDKLLSFKVSFNEGEIKQIAGFICGLPYLGIQILEFIAKLFENVGDIIYFDQLEMIFTNIYNKIESTNQSSNKKQIKYILLQSLMKITISEHINKIQQKQKSIYKKIQNKQQISQSDNIFLSHLRNQAINKMKTCINTIINNSQNINQQLNQKNKKIIDFIFIAIESEALIKLQQKKDWDKNMQIWMIFINWYRTFCKLIQWKMYMEQHMVSLTTKILQNSKIALRMIRILLQKQGCHSQKPSNPNQMQPQLSQQSKMQDLNQSISYYFVRQLLSGLSNYNKYLNYKSARLLVAVGIMHDKLKTYQQILLAPTNIDYIDILMQTFEIEGTKEFYNELLESVEKRAAIQIFMMKVLQQKPKKYLDFFTSVDKYNQGEVFAINDYFLLKFFQQTVPIQLISPFLRNMINYLPSKFCIEMMNSFISKFKGKPQSKIVQSQSARTLNVILITRNANDLCVQFKRHLKDIISSKTLPAQLVFKNVPEKMNTDLAAFYSSAGGTK